MLEIAICENEKRYAKRLEGELRLWAVNAAVNIRIRQYGEGKLLLAAMEREDVFDLIFMEAELDGISGLETAERIRQRDGVAVFVFVSQKENYYREAYHVHPFHVLSRSADFGEVTEMMDAYMKIKNQDMETYSFSIRKAQYYLRLKDILYFYSECRRVTVVCSGQSYSFYGKLNEVQKQLEEKSSSFLRIHQSYLVNARHIKEYHGSNVLLHNGQSLCVSRDNRKSVKEIHRMLTNRQA